MIVRRRVTSQSDPQFQFTWELYEASFPQCERRSKEYHAETMRREIFHAEVILDEDLPIGILFWWELSNFRYIEHLATSPIVRGRGFGERLLREFISQSDKPIILEVEHPTDDISRRRIGFYERIGFKLNDHQYRHPSYQQIEGEFVDLMIMSYPQLISLESMQHFTSTEFPTIHFRNY